MHWFLGTFPFTLQVVFFVFSTTDWGHFFCSHPEVHVCMCYIIQHLPHRPTVICWVFFVWTEHKRFFWTTCPMVGAPQFFSLHAAAFPVPQASSAARMQHPAATFKTKAPNYTTMYTERTRWRSRKHNYLGGTLCNQQQNENPFVNK